MQVKHRAAALNAQAKVVYITYYLQLNHLVTVT